MALPSSTLRKAIACEKLLVIEGHEWTLPSYVALMSRLGEPVPHVLERFCLPDFRQVLTISNIYQHGKPVGVHEGGGYWHTDMAYQHANTVFTSMLCMQCPAQGGGTEFLDCVAGLSAIRKWASEPDCPVLMRDIDLSALSVEHRFGNREQLRDCAANRQLLKPAESASLPPAIHHPLVHQHPLSGQKSIYAPAATSMRIAGIDDGHARLLLDTLFDFLLLHAPRYTHEYQPGDVVIWDNLSTMHCGPTLPRSEGPADARLLYRMNVNYQRGFNHG